MGVNIWSGGKAEQLINAINDLTGHLEPNREHVAQCITSWMNENITDDPTVVIDSSLSVSGAAADAKETGEVKSAINNYEAYGVGAVDASSYAAPWTENKYLDDGGAEASNGGTHYSSYIPVTGNPMRLVFEGNSTSMVARVHGYNSQNAWQKLLLKTAPTSGVNTRIVDTTGMSYIRISLAKVNTVKYIGASLLDARDICYVDGTSGDDTNPGTQTYPLQTIGKAVQSGYKAIKVKPGTYSEKITLNGLDGVSISPYGFPAYSTSIPNTPMIVLDGGSGLTITNGLAITNCTNIRIENVHCKNTSSYPIYVEDCNGLNMKYCKASDSLHAGFYIGDCFGVFESCEAYNLGDENSQYCDGFGIHGYGDTTFIDCSGHDNQDDGISHHYGCTGTVIGGEWYNNGKGGVCTPTYGAQVNIIDVYCHDNAYGIFVLTEQAEGRATKAFISNSVMRNNTIRDLDIRGNTQVLSYNNSYETIWVGSLASFTELPSIKDDVSEITNLTGKMLDVTITQTTNFPYEFVEGRQYCIINVTGKNLAVYARETNNGENTTIHGSLSEGRSYVWTATDDFHFVRLYAVNGTARVIVYDVTSLAGKAAFDANDKEYGNYVSFDYNHDLKDVSSIVDLVDYANKATNPIIEQVTELFDGLVTNYSSYVSKVDAGTYTELTYPEYANGVETAGAYLVTPAYRTYMYRLNDDSVALGNSRWCPKKKMILFGGVHGDEDAAPFNLYQFANLLCTGVMSDPNLFKLRAAFDIYIVPCVNGYGMYHATRANANKVNLNRNFPVRYWTEIGADTIDIPKNQYSGPSAGSEFETQMMVKLMQMIKPDVVVDHHNYARTHQQYYTECFDLKLKNILYQSLVDCSIAFKKTYPQYFGSGYGIVCDTTDGSPAVFRDGVYGTFPTWAGENNIPCAATVEIGRGIYYDNGAYSSTEIDMYGDDTFSIAEYTLQIQLMRFAEYAMSRFLTADIS